MKIGLIGLGRMGGNIARRLMKNGHEVVAYDRDAEAVKKLSGDGAIAADSLDDMRSKLDTPAIWWVMLPSGDPTEQTVAAIADKAAKGEVIIDGGNTFYKDDIRRAKALTEKGLHYVDVGTSGGVWGLERGFCMMIGGEDETFCDARSDLRGTSARARHDRAHARSRRQRGPARGEGIYPCRPGGCGTFREDGP